MLKGKNEKYLEKGKSDFAHLTLFATEYIPDRKPHAGLLSFSMSFITLPMSAEAH